MRRNVFLAMIATALMAWPLAGCGDDDGDPPCEDQCDTELATRCNATTLQTCETNADGCLDWADTTDCAASGQVCQHPMGENAVCVYDCTDECTEPDTTQCNGSVIQTCATQINTCLGWEDGTDCADSGQLCEDATGDAVCTDTCINECTTLNDTQCGGTAIQTCTLGTDGCNDWMDTNDCGAAGRICDDSSGTPMCVVDCTGVGPAVPMNPDPTDGATSVDGNISLINWSDSIGAVSWDYYLGACPVPAYPDPAFVNVTVSEATGINLDFNTTYCWQAVPLDSDGCPTEGPEWIFSTGTCADPIPGAPTVTSALATMVAPGSATYTLTFSEDVFHMDMTALTWTTGVGTGTLDSVTQVDAQTYDVQMSGLLDGDSYTLTVSTNVEDSCGNPLTAAVDIQITVITGGAPGLDCNGPATVVSPNYYTDSNGHNCWTWPTDTADTVNDHSFPCDSVVGGDVVIEYTTGPTDTALHWDAAIANYQSSGYIGIDVTESTCSAPASSLYCSSSTGTYADAGAVPVTPNTTYYIWLVDGYSGHYRPDISACIWSDSACIDPNGGPPSVSSVDLLLPPGTTDATYTLSFDEDVTGVNTTSVTLAQVVGTGTLTNIATVDGQTYGVGLTGMADGDEYELTVAATITDLCGNALTAPVTVTIQVEAPLSDGGDCTNPSDLTSAYHTVDASGRDCWSIPGGLTDTVNDHIFTCDSGVGGDIVIEYTTGPTDTALYWDAVLSSYQTSGNIGVEVTDSPCATGSSLYCAAPLGTTSDLGAYPVQPNTTYYIWVSDASAGHHRPTVDACLWSDNQCVDLVPGAPTVTSQLNPIQGEPSGTYLLTFSEPVNPVTLADLTWTPVVGTGTLDSVTPLSPTQYEVAYSGVVAGDSYTLTVGTSVTDPCGTALVAPVDVNMTISTVTCNEGGGTCAAPLPLSFAGNTAIHYGDVLPSVWGWNSATSHFWSFVATSTNVNVTVNMDQIDCTDTCGAGGTSGAFAGVGIFDPSSCTSSLIQDTSADCIGTLSVSYSSLVVGNTYIVQLRSDNSSYGPYDYELTVVH